MTLLDCWSVIVTRFDGEICPIRSRTRRPARYRAVRPAALPIDAARPGLLLGRSLLERTVVSSADAQAEPEPRNCGTTHASVDSARVLVVRCCCDDKVEARWCSPAPNRACLPAPNQLVQTFADQAVIAIQNARLSTKPRRA